MRATGEEQSDGVDLVFVDEQDHQIAGLEPDRAVRDEDLGAALHGADDEAAALDSLRASGEQAWRIGSIEPAGDDAAQVILAGA